VSKLLYICAAFAALFVFLQAVTARAADLPVSTKGEELPTEEPALPVCPAPAAAADARDACYRLVPAVNGGRCQPQSLIYSRCRTGIMTCRLDDTSPVQWFACEKNRGATTSLPTTGSVLILAANAKRGMPTGHTLHVEDACPEPGGTWLLRLSHTNHDRKCSLDLDAAARFHPASMRVEFLSGAWSAWASHLTALGFIGKR
jgi:hypothetical protein